MGGGLLNMSLCIDKETFVTWFDNQIILLDLVDDEYIVLSQADSKILWMNLIKHQKPIKSYQNINSRLGVSSDCWRLEREHISHNLNLRLIALSLRTLRVVHRTSAEHRLLGLVRLLNNERIRGIHVHKQNRCSIVPSLNAACLIYPRKTKCLEWACALFIVRARLGLKSNLVIGVQNRPFYAHAWVEADGEIIGDDRGLRSKLSIIFDLNKYS
jgi:hypothetical protein